jgi:hypothetical protein
MGTATIGPLALTSVEASGVQWILGDFTGWGAPGGTLTQTQKPRQRGAWSGLSYAKPRPMVATGACIAPTDALASDALDRLISASSLDATLLSVAEGDRSRWCMARRDGDVLPDWVGACAFTYSVQFAADDPRKLGAALSGSTGLPSSTGGFTFPHTFPFAINSTVVSGQVSLFNAGNETGPVTMRIDGPCVGPVITHVGSGLQLIFSASLTLGVGEFLLVDMEAHTAMAQGQSSRANWITSRGWSGLEPGNNTWAFTAASASASLLTVTATPADQ